MRDKAKVGVDSSMSTRAKGAKVSEAEDVSSIPASNRNEQPVRRVPTLAIPNSTARHAWLIEKDKRVRFIDKLTRRISEPGGFVYTSDLALLNQCHTMLCELDCAIAEYRANVIQLLAERPLAPVTPEDIAWANKVIAEAVRS